MRDARQTTLAIMGAIGAAAGFEHGLGELLQGPVAPDSMFIESWPDSAFYESLSGEPAFTVVPNLALSGVLTMTLSAALLVWFVWFVGRRGTAAVIAGISVALLLVGGGFGPPILGLILATAATKVRSPLNWWRERSPGALRRSLASAWPFLLGACLAAWIGMLVGVASLDYLVGFESVALTMSLLAAAFLLLLSALVSSIARDAESYSAEAAAGAVMTAAAEPGADKTSVASS